MQKRGIMEINKRKYFFCKILAAAIVCLVSMCVPALTAKAGLWENPFITFSPDGEAFTTNADEKNTEWYETGYTVYTGRTSALRDIKVGEHYYTAIRSKNVSIGKWVVDYRMGRCIHNASYMENQFHGVQFSFDICYREYYSGWGAYCADCGQKVTYHHTYMSDEAAASIDELDTTLAYYYRCPWCTKLEMGVQLTQHVCQGISANQYSIRYHANFGSGEMPKSVHMYNNATMYEGNAVTPQKHLTLNSFTREGYEFDGWNTEPDGSGTSFKDGQEIYNLCTGEQESIILYAQWKNFWPIVTEKILLNESENVYNAGDVYYVKADGTTSFRTNFSSRVCGTARTDYQINQLHFLAENITAGQEEGILKVLAPMESVVAAGTSIYRNGELQKQYEKAFCLTEASFAEVRRSDYCKKAEITQTFIMGEDMDGQKIRLTPQAGVITEKANVMSDRQLDLINSVYLIADASAPIITGLDIPKEVTDTLDGNWSYTLRVEAKDMGSGVKEFRVEIRNADNGGLEIIEDTDKDGIISLELSSKNSMFWGKFTIAALAKDNVGNESADTYGMDGITVDAYLEKMRGPQTNTYKRGESGILHIQTTGYIERVEVTFPKEWSELDPTLNKIFVYDVPDFLKKEEVEFMVPLQVPDGEYKIVVKAYKADRMVEAKPELLTITVSGSVLDEIRRRLR